MSYGEDNKIRLITTPQYQTTDMTSITNSSILTKLFEEALRLWHGTYKVVFLRTDDDNVLPFVHTILVFIHYLA